MNFWRFPAKIVVSFLLPLLLLSGCAYKRMIFNNLDWLVVYQLDSYLDLTGAQEKSIKAPVHETVSWLKKERLPAITDLLRDVQKTVKSRKIDGKTYEAWLDRIAVWRMETTERVTSPLASLLKQLNAAQIDHLDNKLTKSDRNLVKLLERSESEFPEQFADYVDEVAGSYKFWVGKLRQDQKALMVQKLGWNRATLTEQLKQKRRVRDFWITLLKKREMGQIVAAIRRSAQPDGSWPDPDYQRFRKESRERMQNFQVALFASLDQDQWQHLDKVIKDLLVDLEAMNQAEGGRG